MPDPKDAPTTQFLDGLWEAVKGRAASMAPVFGSGSGGTTLSRDQIDLLWNERHLTPEQEAALWQQGLTPEEIGMQVFKNRERLMKSGGRIEPSQWISWANRQAQRMHDKQQAEQPAPALPTVNGTGNGY